MPCYSGSTLPPLLPLPPSVHMYSCVFRHVQVLSAAAVLCRRWETGDLNVDYSFYRRKLTNEVTLLLNQQEESKLQDDWVKEPFRAATIRLGYFLSGESSQFLKQIFTNKCISKCFYRHCDVSVLTSFSFDLDWPRILQPPAKNTSLGCAHL